MSYILKLLLLSLLIVGCHKTQQESFDLDSEANDFALLDSSYAHELVSQCSRHSPEIQGTWIPTADQIKQLEESLEQIENVDSDLCCYRRARVREVDVYYRQYVGVVLDDKKVIYINAFPKEEIENYSVEEQKQIKWRSEPRIICDGGPEFWGVVYDPATNTFNKLAFNGLG